MSVMVARRGYCYLLWFEALNECGFEFDVEVMAGVFGEFPLMRSVLGYLYSSVSCDVAVPGVVIGGMNVFHVDTSTAVVSLSELFRMFVFSNVRVGGLSEDACVARAVGVRKLKMLVDNAGLSMNELMAEASRNVLKQQVREDNSLLKDVLMDAYGGKFVGKSFVVPHVLSSSELACLQNDYPGLNVVSSGVERHPHGYAAAACMCAEEYMLRQLGYDSMRGKDDIRVIDIGANYCRHVKMKRKGIHCCVPVIDIRDSARETERAMRMKRFVECKEISAETFVNYVRGSKYRCFNKSELCDVKCDYGMMIHSQYDVSFDSFVKMLDMHEFRVMWSVLMFDMSVFYKEKGIVPVLNAFFEWKRDKGVNDIKFSFVQDASMGYKHDGVMYMRMLREQVIVTPGGRTYLVERVSEKTGFVFLKFVYCEVRPELSSLDVEFSYWSGVNDRVVLSSWKYDDAYFLDSVFSKSRVRFERLVFDIPERLYELIMGHCVRSGDKSFNMNEVYSAAQSYNSRMTVNGADIRTSERIPSLDLLHVVVAVYCIAFRERFLAGKVIEAFVSQEKNKRLKGKIGFLDVSAYVVDCVVNKCGGVVGSMVECWNSFVKRVKDVSVSKDVNFCVLKSVRRVTMEEVVNVHACFKDSVSRDDVLNDLRVKSVDVDFDKDVVDAVDKVVNEKIATMLGVSERERKVCEQKFEKKVSVSDSGMSRRVRSDVVNGFHRTVNSLSGDLSESDALMVRSMKKEKLSCAWSRVRRMKGDGHCVFYSLKEHLSILRELDVCVFRRFLALFICDESELNENAKLGDVSGSYDAWGTTSNVTLFSRIFGCKVCVHAVVDGHRFCTELYSYDSNVSGECVHLLWNVNKAAGHVDVIESDDGRVLDLSGVLLNIVDGLATCSLSGDELDAECAMLVQSVCLHADVTDVCVLTETVVEGVQLVGVEDAQLVWMRPGMIDCELDKWYVFECENVSCLPVSVLSKLRNVVCIPDWRFVYGSSACVIVGYFCDKGDESVFSLVAKWLNAYVAKHDLWVTGAGVYVPKCLEVLRAGGVAYDMLVNEDESLSWLKFLCAYMCVGKCRYLDLWKNGVCLYDSVVKGTSKFLVKCDIEKKKAENRVNSVCVNLVKPKELNVDLKVSRGEVLGREVSVKETCVEKVCEKLGLNAVLSGVNVVKASVELSKPGDRRVMLGSDVMSAKNYGVIGKVSLRTDGVMSDRGNDMSLNGNSDKVVSWFVSKSVNGNVECKTVSVDNDGMEVVEKVIRSDCCFRAKEYVDVCVGTERDFCYVCYESVCDCVIESIVESQVASERPCVVAEDGLLLCELVKNVESCDVVGLNVVCGSLSRADCVLHFVHGNVGKGYAGFANYVMKDCVDDFVNLADRRKLSDLSNGNVFISKGNRLKFVVNVVSSSEQFLKDLCSVLLWLNDVIVKSICIDTVAVGCGLWGHDLRDVMRVFDECECRHRYVMHISDVTLYESYLRMFSSGSTQSECGNENVREVLSDSGVSDMTSEKVDSECVSVVDESVCSDSVSRVSGVSKLSWLQRKFGKKERNVFVTVDDVRAGVSLVNLRETDVKCMMQMHMNFPSMCGIGLSFLREDGDKYVVMRGLKKFLGLSSVYVSKSVVNKWLVVEGWKDVWMIERKGVRVLVVKVRGVMIDSLTRILKVLNDWCVNGTFRVGIDALDDVNLLELMDVLTVYNSLFYCLFSYRSDRFASVCDRVNVPVAKVVCDVFPKLSDGELGIQRVPNYLEGVSAEFNFLNAMIEFRHVTGLADDVNAVELKNEYDLIVRRGNYSKDAIKYLVDKGMNVFDNVNCMYVLDKNVKHYMCGYASEGYVRFNDRQGKFMCGDRYVLVSKRTRVMLNACISMNVGKVCVNAVKFPKISWVNGVPGCGKTEFVVSNCRVDVDGNSPRDLVLTITTEGIKDVRKRVNKRFNVDERVLNRDFRTVASVLANGCEEKYERVLIDEALMVHAGSIGFIVALTDCEEVMLLGDRNQIPFIDRDHVCPVKYEHVSKFCSVTRELLCTYRCPIDVCYALDGMYGGMYTKNTCVKSMSRRMFSGCVIPKLKDTLYLVYFQSDKDVMVRDGYDCKDENRRVLTIHEAQGLCWKNVVCVRMSSKLLKLYDSREHAVVAVSRHTNSFVYYTDVNDVIAKMVDVSGKFGENELKKWNMSQMLKPCGWVANEEIMYVRASMREVDVDVGNLPVVDHMPLRSVVTGVGLSDECKPNDILCKFDSDVSVLQEFYDAKMGAASAEVYDYDQVIVENSDIGVAVDRLNVVLGFGPYIEPKFGKLRPVLRTVMSANRRSTQRESILGMAKRNLNAPVLVNTLNPRVLGKWLFRNFVLSCVSNDGMCVFEKFCDDRVGVNPVLIDEWLNKQDVSVRKLVKSDVPMHERRANMFSFMVKPNVKPALDVGSMYKYASVQTIAFNSKDVNVLFCPVMTEMRDRLMSVLRSNVMIMTGLSVEEFEERVNKTVNVDDLGECVQIENDMSKYDKAQAEALFEFEMLLYEALGMDEWLLDIWRSAHEHSVISDRKNGVRIETDYQRKSGDASTFFGNTCVLLAVLSACYDLDDVRLLMVAGDDSVMWMNKSLFANYDPSGRMADLFNLECKLLDIYSVPYFCSKFLVIVDGWMYFVPDVLKFVTKLGRRDMSNFSHVEKYRVSCVDVLKVYANERVYDKLSIGVNERYKGVYYDVGKVCRVLSTLVNVPSMFAKLYVDIGVSLCFDPSSMKVE